MNEVDSRVPGMSRAGIRQAAQRVRLQVGQTRNYLDIITFVDVVLPMMDSTFNLEIASDADRRLQGVHALFIPKLTEDPDLCSIIVGESVYEGARHGNGRDRMTIAHEYGHYELHRYINQSFARTTKELRAFESAEWQAKAFAAELLIDHRRLKEFSNPIEVANAFGVSLQAATYQMEKG